MRLAFAFVILVALSATASARSRWAPTAGAGVVLASNDDTDAIIWAGVVSRPKLAGGVFLGGSVEMEIGEGVVTFIPTLRAGTMVFETERSALYYFSAYVIAGGGVRERGGELDPVMRAGVGVSVPPMLLLTRAGLAVPSVVEFVTDFGGRETVASVRLAWGF